MNLSFNDSLSICNQSNICQFLNLPGKTYSIGNNNSGCNNEVEILESCPILTPDCTLLVSPPNNAMNVKTITTVEWRPVQNSLGYKVSVGTTSGSYELLNNFDSGINNYIHLNNLPCATQMHILVVPYNEFGDALNCDEETFTTEVVNADAGLDRIICLGDTTELSAINSIGANYQWTPTEIISITDSVNTLAFPSDTVVIYLQVSNEGRCQDLDSLLIYVKPLPSFSLSNTDETYHGLNDGTASISGVDSSYSVQWSNGDTTFNISNLMPNEYYVEVSDSFSCVRQDTFLIAKYVAIDADLDGYDSDNDCNDNDPNVNPSQAETAYNGIDDDCDPTTLDDDLDQDGFVLLLDCDDNNPDINPNSAEVCNDIDDNCNNQIDEGLTLATYFADIDGDGFGNPNIFVTDCKQPLGYVIPSTDCDDNNSNINPNQTEIPYNNLDDDCDSTTLDDDLDQDGFLLADDCDDNNSNINPDQAEEPYNEIDDDCNSATLDDDLDQDGFLLADDCDDNNSNINPDQAEEPYNEIDDDCNSATLDDDLDQDGFLLADDCDDNNSNINPDQAEEPYNEIDDDCNSATLDDDLDQDGFLLADDCDDNNSNINPDQAEEPYNEIDDDCNSATLDDDLDQDGFLLADDCDDNNSNINPDQAEEPYNEIDDDCNSATLDDDLDQDGFLLADDCDDNNSNINPGAEEIPNNGIDEDCDGMDLVSSVHELLNSTISIYPNPVTDVINIEIKGQLDYQVLFYDLEGKMMNTSKNLDQIKIESTPQGTYFLQIKDLKTGQIIVERIVIGR